MHDAPDRMAILVRQREVGGKDTSGLDHRVRSLPSTLILFLRCVQYTCTAANQFTARIAEHLLQSAVAADDDAILQECDAGRRVVENRPLFQQRLVEFGGALPQQCGALPDLLRVAGEHEVQERRDNDQDNESGQRHIDINRPCQFRQFFSAAQHRHRVLALYTVYPVYPQRCNIRKILPVLHGKHAIRLQCATT